MKKSLTILLTLWNRSQYSLNWLENNNHPDYEYFIADSPCTFIYKGKGIFKPKWILYEGYIGDITKDSLLTTEVCDTKLELKGTEFESMLELTEFIKGKKIVTSSPKVTSTFTFVDNNYINQMV